MRIPLFWVHPTNPPEPDWRGGADAFTNPASNKQMTGVEMEKRRRERMSEYKD